MQEEEIKSALIEFLVMTMEDQGESTEHRLRAAELLGVGIGMFPDMQ